eukprot:jgi/Botrbrau1/10271/Bobra.0140s0024.1
MGDGQEEGMGMWRSVPFLLTLLLLKNCAASHRGLFGLPETLTTSRDPSKGFQVRVMDGGASSLKNLGHGRELTTSANGSPTPFTGNNSTAATAAVTGNSRSVSVSESGSNVAPSGQESTSTGLNADGKNHSNAGFSKQVSSDNGIDGDGRSQSGGVVPVAGNGNAAAVSGTTNSLPVSGSGSGPAAGSAIGATAGPGAASGNKTVAGGGDVSKVSNMYQGGTTPGKGDGGGRTDGQGDGGDTGDGDGDTLVTSLESGGRSEARRFGWHEQRQLV